MKKTRGVRAFSINLIIILVSQLALAGCGTASETSIMGKSSTVSENELQATDTIQEESEPSETYVDNNEDGVSLETETSAEEIVAESTESNEEDEEAARQAEEAAREAEEQRLAEEAREKEIINSYSMMYYLAFTAENIRTAKNNRLVLDDTYTSLLNDINPGAVDERTQEHLSNLRDIIKSYININTKRDRLQFLYNQKKASAIRSAVPNPLAVLSMTNSLDWKKLATATVYTVVDSYNSYKGASESADLDYIMSGWDLDDEELATVQKNRDRAFDYMVDMVQEYELDGLKTFNEKDVATFTEICQLESPTEKIARLNAEKEKYELFGNYWLELADCYFETDKYGKCLECVDKYNELATGIYRQDMNYVQILPKAIVAARNSYGGDEYITVIGEYADAIISNTTTKDWAARYFAAQVYLDLYTKSNYDQEYLDKAYKIAYENVSVLLSDQRALNSVYTSDVQEVVVTEPDYTYMTKEQKKAKETEYKAEKKRAKEYNKQLKETRKTELPELYEPLVLNCELLFALAEKKGISQTEKNDIDSLLQTSTNGIFYVAPVNDAYSFSKKTEKYSAVITKDGIAIPASLLTKEAKIEIVAVDGATKTVFDDYKIAEVKRNGNTVSEFAVNISSKKWDKYEWTADSKVSINIKYGDAYDKACSMKFKVATFEDHWYGDKVEFEQE